MRWWARSAAVAAVVTVARISDARAVGLEGDGAAAERFGAGLGCGWDQVGGVGRDAYPFLELYGEADARLLGGAAGAFAVGAGASLRRDLGDYNFALSRWRGGSNGAGLHLALGYDGPAFHLSLGPWLVGDSRDGDHFRGGLVPIGVVRLRAGHQDAWHVAVHLIDGVPSTAGGGAVSLRLELAPPPRGVHRLRFGVYVSAAEDTAGLSVSDEWPIARATMSTRIHPRIRATRAACLLGTDLAHAGVRPELTCSAGVVF